MAECRCPKSFRGKYLDVEFKGAVTIHLPECTWGAGLTGDEWETRESHEDARAATDEAYEYDAATMKARAEKGE